MKSTKINLKQGEHLFDGRNDRPEITVNGDGPKTYIWIGNDGERGGCFATLSGVKTLEKLAMTILRELGHEVTLK